MDWTNQCAAVVPCFNEAGHIGEVIAGIRRHLNTVIVVDDGSADATAEIARSAGAEVIRLPRNQGKGAALRIGWERAHQHGFTWALTLDGDGQHAANDIPAFFAHAAATRASLIVGNRMDHPATMPHVRRFVNRWMSRRLSHLTGARLPDSQCGFRLLHLDSLSRLTLDTDHFEIESETLVAFLDAGHNVEFVPIQVIYKNDASKIHPFLDTFRWLRWRLTCMDGFRNYRPSRAS